ncbi:hypothetical protein CEXT_448421 [Caerostris extrusa]|uniref:Uncharacterized protein n=1 Tax=Caerostris extrusa TaxID=172846 RepID=A0AAV4MEI3_CAEEX|nr:hypothetical protein CEXT_448421 [Caerostris extrusa]
MKGALGKNSTFVVEPQDSEFYYRNNFRHLSLPPVMLSESEPVTGFGGKCIIIVSNTRKRQKPTGIFCLDIYRQHL